MNRLSEMSASQLEKALSADFPIHWLGTSFGLMMSVSSVFWRFEVKRWKLLYGEGDGAVWYTSVGNPIFRGETPPPITTETNIIALLIFISGFLVVWLSNVRRNAIVKEMRKRREKP